MHPSRGLEYPDRAGMAKTEIPARTAKKEILVYSLVQIRRTGDVMNQMDQTLERYIETILPWRLNALRNARLFISFVKQYPEGGESECRVKGKLKLAGKSTVITNPSLVMGLIHSRVLLGFLGLRVASEGTLSKAYKHKDDINIESFGLAIVTSNHALLPCTEDKEKAEAAFVQTITAANKLVAHSTEMVDLSSDAVNSYFICCTAIPVLFNLYFYKPLGIEMPNIDPSSKPATPD